MKLNLSKLELFTLQQLCSGPKTPKELSEVLNAKLSFISRALTSLNEKRLVSIGKKITTERIRQKLISLSIASHAEAFKRLYDSRPNGKIEQWLSGMAMDILVILSEDEEVPITLLLEEAYSSPPTVYKYLKLLYGAGVVNRSQKGLIVTDRLAKKFVNEYAKNMRLKLCEKISMISAIVRIRKHVVIRTTSQEIPPSFSRTGITYLITKGLKTNPTIYSDYYFELDEINKSLDLETAFVHAVLLTQNQQQQDMPVLAVFLIENWEKIRLRWLRAVSKIYGVEEKIEELIVSATYYQKAGRSE
jgi:predicted transcriptional regulator